eukprot:1138840-Pelagomonas_calceolata.AAC.3
MLCKANPLMSYAVQLRTSVVHVSWLSAPTTTSGAHACVNCFFCVMLRDVKQDNITNYRRQTSGLGLGETGSWPFMRGIIPLLTHFTAFQTPLTLRHGHVCLQGHNQAVASPFRRAEASSAAKPIAVEQALLQSQLCRAQTSVGVTTPFSQRGASLGHLSSSDGSLKSNSTDAGLSRRSTVSGHCWNAAQV